MDVDEIISFEPSTPRLKHDPGASADHRKSKLDVGRDKHPSKRKVSRFEPADLGAVEAKRAREDEKSRILAAIDADTGGQDMSEVEIRKIAVTLDRRAVKNNELRVKYADKPQKFMSSEIELHDSLQEMLALAAMPQYYNVLLVSSGGDVTAEASSLSTKVIDTVLQLINHENTDISVGVIHLLHELTDPDSIAIADEDDEDIQHPSELVVDIMFTAQIVGMLVSNASRLEGAIGSSDNPGSDEAKEMSSAVHESLGICENLFELQPSKMTNAAISEGLLEWLLKRIGTTISTTARAEKSTFDENRLYASEILAILCQGSAESTELTDQLKAAVGEHGGIDDLLQQLAAYKRSDPSGGATEVEFMENCFDALCCCLMRQKNRAKFLHGEGLQLMNLMLRERKSARIGALRVLDHALCAPTDASTMANAHKFIDILGLRSIFPLLMKPPKEPGSRKEHSADANEEHIVAIALALVRNIGASVSQFPSLAASISSSVVQQHRQRLASKFTENDYEKIDRLVELHFKYTDYVRRVTSALASEEASRRRKGTSADDDRDKETREGEAYLRKLDGGLFVLQQVDFIILEICCGSWVPMSASQGTSADAAATKQAQQPAAAANPAAGPVNKIRQRVLQLLSMRGGSANSIRTTMREYAGNLGDADDSDQMDEGAEGASAAASGGGGGENALKRNRDHILQLISKF